MLEDCFSKVSDLKKIFEGCLPEDGSSKFTRGWKALVSMKYDKKIDEISKVIQKHVTLLTYHHVSIPVTASQAIDSNTAGVANLSMRSRKKSQRHFMVPIYW